MTSPGDTPTTAGAMLRRARQAQGLHIAALAASIKVVPRKLELLESDQFDQLPDATFTRALAQTVCRTLKIDAAPVLALLPPASSSRLDHVAEGLNTPYRERPGRLVPKEWAVVAGPAIWLAGLLLVAALAIYVMPAGWISMPGWAQLHPAAPAAVTPVPPTANAASVPAIVESPPAANATPVATPPATAASQPVAATATDATGSPLFPPALATDADAGAALPPGAAGALQVRASAPSWLEVTDARGQALIARLVQPGESIGLDGAPPFKLKIGNAGAVAVVFRGQPVELAAHTRDNVVRMELK